MDSGTRVPWHGEKTRYDNVCFGSSRQLKLGHDYSKLPEKSFKDALASQLLLSEIKWQAN